MLSKCKWNGDPRPFKKDGPLPKGDPRDKINSHIRSQAKREIQRELRNRELEIAEEEFHESFVLELS
jgi:hypothetical protein